MSAISVSLIDCPVDERLAIRARGAASELVVETCWGDAGEAEAKTRRLTRQKIIAFILGYAVVLGEFKERF
jgi:hypothetical protein